MHAWATIYAHSITTRLYIKLSHKQNSSLLCSSPLLPSGLCDGVVAGSVDNAGSPSPLFELPFGSCHCSNSIFP